MTDLKITKGSANVFADLGFGPQESQNLLLRSQTMIALVQWFNASGLTQAAAAKTLGVSHASHKLPNPLPVGASHKCPNPLPVGARPCARMVAIALACIRPQGKPPTNARNPSQWEPPTNPQIPSPWQRAPARVCMPACAVAFRPWGCSIHFIVYSPKKKPLEQ